MSAVCRFPLISIKEFFHKNRVVNNGQNLVNVVCERPLKISQWVLFYDYLSLVVDLLEIVEQDVTGISVRVKWWFFLMGIPAPTRPTFSAVSTIPTEFFLFDGCFLAILGLGPSVFAMAPGCKGCIWAVFELPDWKKVLTRKLLIFGKIEFEFPGWPPSTVLAFLWF